MGAHRKRNRVLQCSTERVHSADLDVAPNENSYGDYLGDDFALVLRNGEQDLLRVAADVDESRLAGLSELYEFARRHALRVDATVDQVLGDLAKL